MMFKCRFSYEIEAQIATAAQVEYEKEYYLLDKKVLHSRAYQIV